MLRLRLEANPILVREVRARWRKWPAFAVAGGYSILLALWMGWCYAQAVSHAPVNPSPRSGAPKMGSELFWQLSMMQIILWMLLAPALTATSISGERERGLLDGLQLSPLTPRQIVNGKLLSALSFISLMLLVPLPIIALCFILGGVSPGEFLAATVLQFTVATTCAAIGLASSAVTRGPLAALGQAVGIIILLNCTCFCCGSPLFATAAFQRGGFSYGAIAVTVGIQLVILRLQLRKAADALRQTLPQPNPYPFMPSPGPWDYNRTPVATTVAEAEASSPSASSPPSDTWQWKLLPFASRLRFKNPVLHHEVQRHMRLQRDSLGVAGAIFWSLCLYGYTFLLPAFFDASGRRFVFWLFAYASLFVVILVTALFSSATFAREREQHTWEALRLTPLTVGEIIRGKLAAPLVLCLYYSLPWLPIAALCVRGLSRQDTRPGDIALTHLLAVLLIIGASAWCTAAWGLLLSWLSRRVWIATAWTVVSLLFALVFSPWLFGPPRSFGLLHLTHPYFMLQTVQSGLAARVAIATAGPALLLFGTGCALLAILHHMVRNPREGR